MNEPINTGISKEPVTLAPPVPSNFLGKIWNRIPQRIKDVLIKFYANKKIFWLVVGSVGLILFTLIMGLVFGIKTPLLAPKNSPSPLVQSTPEASPSGDILTVTAGRLRELKLEINSIDVAQSRLKPPVINYDIKF